MTTKYKIIVGFLFMIVLLAGLSIFAWMRLSGASRGFNDYRVESHTTVNANASDALMREAKDNMSNFIITLDKNLVDQARKNLEGSRKYVLEAREVELDPARAKDLDEQAVRLRKLDELAVRVRDRLLDADKNMQEKIIPSAEAINEQLTAINMAAQQAGNMSALEFLDAVYSLYADFRVAVRIYCATYLPEDGVKSFGLLKEFEDALKTLEGSLKREETKAAYDVLWMGYQNYLAAFKEIDAEIKESRIAREQFVSTVASAVKFFDEYTSESHEDMNRLGASNKANNEGAQKALAVGSTAGVILGALFALWIILGVVRVLTRVAAFSGEIAKGNFEAELNVREGGEIGSMVKSIMVIPATLKNMVTEYHHLENRFEEGYLGVDGDTSKFSGGFAAIIQGSNNILRRVRMIFDSIPSPVVVLNRNLQGSYLNKVAQDLAGNDYQGKTCKELFGREDYGTATCGLTNAAVNKRVSSGETVAHTRKGKRLDINYTAIPMLDANGNVVSVLQMIIDLTQIKETQRKILEVARQAQEISDRVATASEQLAAQVEQVSRGAEVQRVRMESTVSAMAEMNSTVMEVARSAGQASEQSENTRKKAEDGAQLVNKVVSAINTVNTVAANLQENMQDLGKQAESIGGVMNVISDIADQTNLLALNAAIEAARAGEAGRGFAVVADEVRKLAEKTMQATKEVGDNINSIQNSAHVNIQEVDKAAKSVHEATSLADSSGAALREIVDLAAANSGVVTSIATAADEQSATSEEINRALDEINRIAGETADGMGQSSSAVQDLSGTAQRLKQVMEGLRG